MQEVISGCSIVVVRRAGGAVVRVRFTASRHRESPLQEAQKSSERGGSRGLSQSPF